MGRFGEVRGLRQCAGLRLINDGLALADYRGRRRDRLTRRIRVAVIQHQDQLGLRLLKSVGGHDRGEGKGCAVAADAFRQQAGEVVARLLGAGAGFDWRVGKALGERVDLRGGEGFGFHGAGPSGVGDVGRMAEGGDRVDHGAAIADRRAKSLSLGQGRELIARAGGGRAAPGGDKVGGVLQAEFFVCCQGLHGGLLCVAMAADSG